MVKIMSIISWHRTERWKIYSKYEKLRVDLFWERFEDKIVIFGLFGSVWELLTDTRSCRLCSATRPCSFCSSCSSCLLGFCVEVHGEFVANSVSEISGKIEACVRAARVPTGKGWTTGTCVLMYRVLRILLDLFERLGTGAWRESFRNFGNKVWWHFRPFKTEISVKDHGRGDGSALSMDGTLLADSNLLMRTKRCGRSADNGVKKEEKRQF